RTLRHTCLQVHRMDVLDDGATGLLRPKAAGDILSTFPGTGINEPAFAIPAMLQPPAEIGRSFRIEAAQPEQVARPTHYLVATPYAASPNRRLSRAASARASHLKAVALVPKTSRHLRDVLPLPGQSPQRHPPNADRLHLARHLAQE